VEIRHRQQFGLALGQPFLSLQLSGFSKSIADA
jgi:hypothetical protein